MQGSHANPHAAGSWPLWGALPPQCNTTACVAMALAAGPQASAVAAPPACQQCGTPTHGISCSAANIGNVGPRHHAEGRLYWLYWAVLDTMLEVCWSVLLCCTGYCTGNNLSTHLMLVLASPKKALPLSICGGLTSTCPSSMVHVIHFFSARCMARQMNHPPSCQKQA